MKINSKKIAEWRNGSSGFLKWLDDVQPKIPSSRGGFEIFQPAQFQIDAITAALETDQHGNWKFQTICISMPRRHSKSTLAALLALWRFFNYQTENIVVLANSMTQVRSVGFSLCTKIIRNTPFLLGQVGEENIRQFSILYPALQSQILAVSSSPSGLYGQKISCAWISEIHAAPSDESMQVLASSLGDTVGSWLLVDSTVDSIGGPLHRLEKLYESGEDPTVFSYRLSYKNLDEALKKSPPWINKSWLKSREKQLLPGVFGSQHLNQRSEASNNLFARVDIERAQERLPHPMSIEDLEQLTHGRNFITGAGLDRAYFGSLHGDKTIFTSVAKVAGIDNEEPNYYVLHQKNILGSLGNLIKKTITQDFKAYKLSNIVFESYNSQDVYVWSIEQKYPAEVVHAVSTSQIPAMTELYRIVKEGRLHFSKDLTRLADEMITFLYELKNGKPRFGTDRIHDDRVYSLAWGVYATRQHELASYSLPSIICESKSKHASLCYLRSGDMVLHCSSSCEAHKRVEAMYFRHRSHRVESEITLPEFFEAYVKVAGCKIYNAF